MILGAVVRLRENYLPLEAAVKREIVRQVFPSVEPIYAG
jgi:hypothetical protein